MVQSVLGETTEIGFDQRRFRDALGCFVTGITVVTGRTSDDLPCGVTIGSFSSLSLDPPLVLFTLSSTSASFASFDNMTHFNVHVLADHQKELAEQFARSGINRFAGLELEEGSNRTLLIPGVAARFDCEMLDKHPGGDHVIFVGRVIDFTYSPHRRPIVFHRGEMRRLLEGRDL